jgi:hypothetical protein
VYYWLEFVLGSQFHVKTFGYVFHGDTLFGKSCLFVIVNPSCFCEPVCYELWHTQSLYFPAIVSPRKKIVFWNVLWFPSYILGRLFLVVDLLFRFPHVFMFAQWFLFFITLVWCTIFSSICHLIYNLRYLTLISQLIGHYSLLFWIHFWQTTLRVLCWSVIWLNCTFCCIVESSFFTRLVQLTILCPHVHS